MEGTGKFLVIEGLSGVGKSTLAPMVAERVRAIFLPTIPPEFDDARRYVDSGNCVLSRFYVFLAANYATAGQVKNAIGKGQNVVIESYFYRTLATHAAMGVRDLPKIDWSRSPVPDLAVLLKTEESVRQARLLARRTTALTKWHQLVEKNLSIAVQVYSTFQMLEIDTTSSTPDDVATAIASNLSAPKTDRRVPTL